MPTVVDFAAGKNTLVMPFPVEPLRFFDKGTTEDTAAIDRTARSARQNTRTSHS